MLDLIIWHILCIGVNIARKVAIGFQNLINNRHKLLFALVLVDYKADNILGSYERIS